MLEADDVLRGLLVRAERAQVRSSERAVQQSFAATDSAYWRLSLDARDRFHARMRAAAARGAVTLAWARQGGDDRPLEVVRVRDRNELATFLGAETVAGKVALATAVLAPWAGNPRVVELLTAWGAMRKVRAMNADAAGDFADALRVLDAVQTGVGEDQIVRSLSATLFGDSKRLEQLDRHLDVLTAENLASPARHREEVFGLLGLVKEPQPFLVAGTGSLTLVRDERCPIVWPYVGVANKQVAGYSGAPEWVMTIENLTTFHVASQLREARAGLIVFTGGMPSPSWCRAYARVLRGIPLSVPCYHWGDIDQGGFRIAAHLKAHCVGDRKLMPWLMDASDLGRSAHAEVPGGMTLNQLAPAAVTSAMARGASAAGWHGLAARIAPVCIEQESLQVHLPLGAEGGQTTECLLRIESGH